MNKTLSTFIALIGLSFFLSSCEVIGAIFKTGMWTGVIIVVIILAAVIFVARSFRNKK